MIDIIIAVVAGYASGILFPMPGISRFVLDLWAKGKDKLTRK